MATKVVFLLACVIAHVSCGENSLILVIDDTSSMTNEIRQVKEAAKSIVDIVLTEKQSQIEDIVLVTFNDPGAVLRIKTRDERELKAALDSITVHQGDDCPEAVLAGVSRGLEEGRPGSHLYVFSDASAKDYNKFEEVKALAQEKLTKITFILTGHCADLMKESYQVYHKLARATHGEVFRITENDIAKVLGALKETIKGPSTVLESETIPPNTWRVKQFTIDERTEYAVVSVSGRGVSLTLLDQNNRFMPRDHINYITWTQNVKVLKLANVPPGTYKAKVRGSSEVNIKVFGRTDFSFRHGFSTEPRTSLEGTDTQPTTGVETHLLVSMQDETHSTTAERVELRDMAGRVVMTLPLARVSGDVYRTDKFLPPKDTFQITVVASSKNSGKTMKREAKTPVTPLQSARPVIDKTVNFVTADEGASVELHCRASGKPRPVLAWFVQQEDDSEFSPLRPPGAPPALTVAADHAARYKCVATNAAGRDQHELQLLVRAKPKIETLEANQSVKVNGTIDLRCRVTKGSHVAVNWFFKAPNSDNYVIVSSNEVLHLENIQTSSAGQYKCVAQNEIGKDEQHVELVIHEPPAIDKTENDNEMTVQEGGTVDLLCRIIKGSNTSITWFYRSLHSDEYVFVSSDEVLRLENVQPSSAGRYKCEARNEAGVDELVVQVSVKQPPVIDKSESIVKVKEGASVDLHCRINQGLPVPQITWYAKKQGQTDFAFIGVIDGVINVINGGVTVTNESVVTATNDGVVRVTNVLTNDYYKCVAKNVAGEDEHILQLDVQVPPTFQVGHHTAVAVKEGYPVIISCKLQKGNPRPEIAWLFRGRGSSSYQTLEHGGEELVLESARPGQAGHYVCAAGSPAGRNVVSIELIVYERRKH